MLAAYPIDSTNVQILPICRREHPGRIAPGRNVFEMSAALPEQTSLTHPTFSKPCFLKVLISVRIALEHGRTSLLGEGFLAHTTAPQVHVLPSLTPPP